MDTQPKARKAGHDHREERDTTHPMLITELFMGFLGAVGKPAKVLQIWKNTREEAMWSNALLPWRRSPLWLLIRVALQLIFTRAEVTAESQANLYKPFMAFVMARILNSATQPQSAVPSRLLYVMNAKLARRLLKLDSSDDIPGLEFVQKVMSDTHEAIDRAWSSTMKKNTPDFDVLRHLEHTDFGQNVTAALPQLEECIMSMAKREMITTPVNFQPTSALVKWPPGEFPLLRSDLADGEYGAFNLAAFEVWVASNLTQWLQVHKGDHHTCDKLGEAIKRYHSAACSSYLDNPEATSVMLLTILELWIACDESAVHIHPLLRNYDPEVPLHFLQSFVLPFKSQMERLRRVEKYLDNRSHHVKFPGLGMFLEFGHPESFPVRFVSQSWEHESLLEEIISRAHRQREMKRDELHTKKQLYDTWTQLYDQSKCNCTLPRTSRQRRKRVCERCDHKDQAESLNIDVHEWPLPSDCIEAKATVFELRVPPVFGRWRDTAIYLLLDVLRFEYRSPVSPKVLYHLGKCPGFGPFFTPFGPAQRIGLLSEIKPHVGTHRRTTSVATATEADVCLETGLKFQYYDDSTRTFSRNLCLTKKIPRACTYKLPKRSSSLQQFLFRPAAMPGGLPPNTVLASQSECPDHMSLEEYKALSSIPLGHRIQWQNILLQLSTSAVDFTSPETGPVILQAIHQAGPCRDGNAFREGHVIANDETFALTLLRSIGEGVQRIKENWDSSQALGTFLSLALRLLSLASSDKVKAICLDCLSSMRTIAFDWVNLIRGKADMATEGETKADMQSKVVETALLCVDSFNVDQVHLDAILASPSDTSILLRCRILIREARRSISNASDHATALRHRRQESLSHRSYQIIAREILEGRSPALDNAIGQSWSAYHAGGPGSSFRKSMGIGSSAQQTPEAVASHSRSISIS